MDRVVNILLISDEVYVKNKISSMFGDRNEFVLDIMDNAKMARESLMTKNYDIVITDAMIWGLTSLEVIKILKDRKIYSCVIVLADLTTAEIAQKTVKEGAFGYIIKPPELDKVESYVKLYKLTKYT
ncbi:MAG: response regulator [Elusimicrobiales bacterium]|nr:response regulator [Elusimicrobiales bacterium]